MRFSSRYVALFSLLVAAACSSDGPSGPGTPDPLVIPAVEREFRGMWIATVANIDWPSTAGLSAAAQQAEMNVLLDAAQNAGLNAVILQVRAAGDALYTSSLEPWAKSLTGTQGGNPGYDPLAYAVQAAHARGLELHAWFNPFRAANLSDTLNLAANHFAKVRPDVTRRFCTQLWFDPAEDAVQDHAIAVMKDVVARYTIDAVHIDDFFYPYPTSTCPGLDFPDSAGYAAFIAGGGSLGKAEWRRANVNRFVQRLYNEVHATNNAVRVGVSPFGIWRPGNPAGVVGLDAYASIYADSKLWLQQGWVDYFAPQLYWSIASTGQSFPALLQWWGQQNTQRRHLWPGLASYRINDGSVNPYAPSEIPNQVAMVRAQRGTAGYANGTILYNGSSVRTNRGGFVSTLQSDLYSTRALPPATTWLDATAPATPVFTASESLGALNVVMTPNADAYWWLVRWRAAGVWYQRLVPGTQTTVSITTADVDGVVVNAVDRVGNLSSSAVQQ